MTRPAPIAVLIAALATIACAPDAPQQAKAEKGAAPAATSSAATSSATTARDVPLKPGAIKTFGDWSVGCDNGWRCTMASLQPEDAMGEGPTLTLIRNGGLPGAWSFGAGDGSTPKFAVDGRPVGSDAAAVAAAMANGTTLKIAGQAGTISLKGASAALRYIDAAQQRAGTTSAIVAQGAATAVPNPPAMPIVRAIPLVATDSGLTPAQIATMAKRAECEDMSNANAPTLGRAGKDTLIVALPCSAGAYNVIMALFVVQNGTATPAQVDAAVGFDATGADSQTPVHSVVNGGVENGLLTSYAKGRGLGDCGLDQKLAWDGSRLRLVEQSEMPECRGNTDTITTWRATVAR